MNVFCIHMLCFIEGKQCEFKLYCINLCRLGNESIDVIIFSSNTNFSIVGKPVQGGKSRSGRFRLNKKLFL